jgi:hypothetical protein
MNNEPVAYINIEERKLEWAKPMTWHTPTIAQMEKIPLYTHPVKELTDGNNPIGKECQKTEPNKQKFTERETMKPSDEYKVCSLEEAEEFAKKRRKDLREMNTGLFDDIQINNPDRDKAWEAFIKRKDVEGWAVDKEGFPLNGFYDVWCIAWSKAQEK